MLLPGFPDDRMQIATVGSAGEITLGEAFAFYAFIRRSLEKNGTPLGPKTQILDFGVGWGRIIRFFLRETDPGNLHGVDVAEEFLDAARTTGCMAKLQKIEPHGSLPYADERFDLVYAYSVFTHLPEPVQDLWLAEISRTLKQGGLFIATIQPPRFLDLIRSSDPADPKLHPWLRGLALYLEANPGVDRTLEEKGSVYLGMGDAYGDRVMSAKYVREHWSRWFEFIQILDDPTRFTQAVVTLRK